MQTPEPRVLFIDDSSLNLKLAKAQFQQLGINCSLCLRAEDALELIETHSFSAILTDISMPGMDGMALTRRVRVIEAGTGQRIPVIAVSSCSRANVSSSIKRTRKVEISNESLAIFILPIRVFERSPGVPTELHHNVSSIHPQPAAHLACDLRYRLFRCYDKPQQDD